MGEHELSSNEKFVCCFSSFLCEAMKNAYFVVDTDADNEIESVNSKATGYDVESTASVSIDSCVFRSILFSLQCRLYGKA